MMGKEKTRKEKKSFTLIELVIVFSIIVILTSITVVFFKPGREKVDLVLSAHQLAQDIRYIEDLSLSGKEISPGVFPHGYGIEIYSSSDPSYPNQYLIFADKDGNNVFNSGDVILKGRLSLGKGVNISSLNPDSPLSIVAVPPDPDIFVNNSSSDGTIELSLKSNPVKKIIITINIRGLVEINE